MKKLVEYFFSGYNFISETGNFRKLLYLVVTVKIFYWLSFYNLFFGNNAFAYTQSLSLNFIKDYAYVLYSSQSKTTGYVFLYGALILVLLSYSIKKIPFVFEFILWFLVLNIHNKLYPTLTGGSYLINQFLFFNCFFSKRSQAKLDWKKSISVCFHNFGITATILQILMVYFIAALSKLNDIDWLHGDALYKISKVGHYNMFSTWFNSNYLVDVLLNYVVLGYQLLFPVLVWIKKIKKMFLLIGVLMHLYIAFVIGLVEFGSVMIISHIIFWPIKKQ